MQVHCSIGPMCWKVAAGSRAMPTASGGQGEDAGPVGMEWQVMRAWLAPCITHRGVQHASNTLDGLFAHRALGYNCLTAGCA